eukprot:1839223-Amphidinium_carterae.1
MVDEILEPIGRFPLTSFVFAAPGGCALRCAWLVCIAFPLREVVIPLLAAGHASCNASCRQCYLHLEV